MKSHLANVRFFGGCLMMIQKTTEIGCGKKYIHKRACRKSAHTACELGILNGSEHVRLEDGNSGDRGN